jgi:hypothetical protein
LRLGTSCYGTTGCQRVPILSSLLEMVPGVTFPLFLNIEETSRRSRGGGAAILFHHYCFLGSLFGCFVCISLLLGVWGSNVIWIVELTTSPYSGSQHSFYTSTTGHLSSNPALELHTFGVDLSLMRK